MLAGAVPAAATRVGAVDVLVDAVEQLRGLTEQVGPFALPPDTCGDGAAVVAAVSDALEVPLTFDAPTGRETDHAAVALAAGIRRAAASPDLLPLAPAAAAEAARRMRVLAEARCERHTLRREDGSAVQVLAAGPPGAPSVVISVPPGLSSRLALPWLEALAPRFRCVIPQSRGTSGRITDVGVFDRHGFGFDRQVSDLVAVVAAFAGGPTHLMGLCGGSGIALAAAAGHPALIRSVSLWHADLDLGADAEMTHHQLNLRAVVDLAARSRDDAGWLRAKLVSGPMSGVPDSVGPLVVRPYATTELFYRYAALTEATVHRDCRDAARATTQPVLVATSEDDATTHPAGSRLLARIAPDAQLAVADHGDHLEAFAAREQDVTRLTTFLGQA